MKRILLVILFFWLFYACAQADTGFVVNQIRIVGLQRVSPQTVYNYLPIKNGQVVDTNVSAQIIQSLYATGFFNDVSLSRQGNNLIITVQERPIIGKIVLTGNKSIPNDKLNQALKGLGVQEGLELNSSTIDEIKSSLENEYFTLGKYNARVNVAVIPAGDDLVTLKINISEGLTAKIKQIKIVGNQAICEALLLKQFKLSLPNLLSFYTHNDIYSDDKLNADLDTLRTYYLDRGFLRFKVNSAQVSVSPDRTRVYITISVSEGAQYRISGINLTGKLILPRQQLMAMIPLHTGDIFSKSKVLAAENNIINALGNKGYAQAVVNIVPSINDVNKTVFLNFQVQPGVLTYVRWIDFTDNNRTNDIAIRRVLLQTEGSLMTTSNMDESKRQILLLPYVKDVQVKTIPVPGSPDKMDIDYQLTEQHAASATFGVGYSDLDGFIVSAGLTQPDFLGTGNSFGISASTSDVYRTADINYYNPYYTESGIGRSIDVYASKFDADAADLTDYTTSHYGVTVGYDMPITLNSKLQWGYTFEHLDLETGGEVSNEVQDFINDHGKHFNHLDLNAGWVSDTFDRYNFPTLGLRQDLSLTVSVPFMEEPLEYYTIEYEAHYYHPIWNSFIGTLRGNIGYGNGYGSYNELPFFENFFAGGIGTNGAGTVRGFESNTLGPNDSLGNPLGGNFELDGTAGLVFPNPFGQNLRTTWFVDAGNAFNTEQNTETHDGGVFKKGIHLNELRYSTGLDVSWMSPLGPIEFSLGKALNKQKGDQTEFFQFNIGTSF